MARMYTTWPGRNRFLPCGCIIGPISDTCANFYVYGTFILVFVLYCVFVLPTMWAWSPAIPILFMFAVVFTLVFMALTQCTDPGIIPRRPYLEK